MKLLQKFCVLLFLCFFSSHLFANPKIQATAEPSELSVGEQTTLVISIDYEGDPNVEAADQIGIPNFEFLGKSSSSQTRAMIVNGQFSYQKTLIFNYILSPTQSGKLIIPPISIFIDNKEFKTNSVRVDVFAANSQNRPNSPSPNQRPGQGNLLDDMMADEVDRMDEALLDLLRRRGQVPTGQADIDPKNAYSIKLELDKTKAFVGEQVTANYYIYIPRENLLSNFDNMKFPQLKDFWKEDIQISTRLNFEQVMLGGKIYNKALLASYALFPIKAGKAKIDEYRVKCMVQKNSLFGSSRVASVQASEIAYVNVLPLPSQGAPKNFKSAVGQFNIEASLEANQKYIAHQAFTYKIKIEGKGNAKSLDLPELNLPSSIEIFDQKEDAKFFTNGRSYKEFTLYMIPREAGELTIPPAVLAYFDPEKSQFKEVRTEAFKITVSPGIAPQGQSTNNIKENNKIKEVLKLPAFATDLNWQPVLSTKWQNIILFALFLICLGVLLFKAKITFVRKTKKQSLMMQLNAKLKILKLEQSKKDLRAFGVAGTNAIYFCFANLVGTEGGGENLSVLLQKISPVLRKEIESKLVNVLDAFQALSFAPDTILKQYSDEKLQKQLIQDTEFVLIRLLESELIEEE